MGNRTRPLASRSWQLCATLLWLLVTGCSPLGWLMAVSSITADDLSKRLMSYDQPIILDLRSRSDFAAGHIPTAHRVAFGDVGSAARRLNESQQAVLVCQRGNLAALAVASVRGVGHDRVSVLEGGYERWLASHGAVETADRPLVETPKDQVLAASWTLRALVWTTGSLIKPCYMLMAFGLIWWLRRTDLRGLRRLRLGLIVFLAGESACLFNFYLSDPKAPFQWLESLHELGMAVGSAYIFWGLYAVVETKFIAMNDLHRGCAMVRLCGTCTRQPDVLCRPQRQLRHVLLLLVPLALLPWSQDLLVRDTSLDVFGTSVDYRWPILNQMLELRLFPLLAAVALSGSWVLLGRHRQWLERASGLLFFGLGLLSFAVFRGLLDATFTRQPYFADTWEEATELMGIATIGWLLWVFRVSLELSSATDRPKLAEERTPNSP